MISGRRSSSWATNVESGKGLMRQLGQLEAVVMARVWESDESVLVREVLEQIQRERDIAYTTVRTVMDNLHRKGVASREREGRAYRYRAVRSRAEHTADLMEEVLAASEDKAATLMHFVQQIDDGELDALRELLVPPASPKTVAPVRASLALLLYALTMATLGVPFAASRELV